MSTTVEATGVAHRDDQFRADIQGLRAIAVIGVLAFHAGVPFVSGGFVGVDVFYVISGFLITGLMLRDAQRNTRRQQLVDFYARRVRRILPAAAVVVLATLLLAFALQDGVRIARAVGDARSATLFYSNVHFVKSSNYFDAGQQSIFQQYWSLSVEEQFYAIWPLLFLALGLVLTPRRRRVGTAMVVGAISLASFALNVAWATDKTWLSLRPSAAFYLLPARAWELGVGVFLALAAGRLARLAPWSRAALRAAGVAAIVISMIAFDAKTDFPGWAALLPTLGAAAAIAAGMGVAGSGIVHRALANRLAQAGGRYSYSLYLWHWPILLLVVPHLRSVGSGWTARLLVMTALTVPAAVVTYHLVEDPVRRAKLLRDHAGRSFGVGAAAIALSLVAALLVNSANTTGLRTNLVAHTAPVDAAHPVIVPTDFVPRNLTPSLVDSASKHYRPDRGCGHYCVVADRPGKRTIALYGDSHAEHLAPAIERAASQLGVGLREDIYDGCRWYSVPLEAQAAASCTAFRAETVQRLRRDPPALLVLSARSDQLAKSPQLFEAAIRNALSALGKLLPETTLLVVGDTPVAAYKIPECLAEHLSHANRCDQTSNDALNARIATVAAESGATFLDLRPVLCDAQRCPAITGNQLIWRDDDHLTVAYSAALAGWFREQLRPLVPGARAFGRS